MLLDQVKEVLSFFFKCINLLNFLVELLDFNKAVGLLLLLGRILVRNHKLLMQFVYLSVVLLN